MEFLTWLEHSGFAMTIKGSTVLYELPLVFHAIGMAILVGFSTAVYLRILGVASSVPLAPLERFFPVMYAGFWINAASGVLLFSLYPIKAVTNPVFFIKMGGVVLAVVCLRRIKHQVFGNRAIHDTRVVAPADKVLAGTALFVWLATITAGRLMAYHGIAGVEWSAAFAVSVVAVTLVLAGFAAARILGGSSPSPLDVHDLPVTER